jgi:hypothetical protein
MILAWAEAADLDNWLLLGLANTMPDASEPAFGPLSDEIYPDATLSARLLLLLYRLEKFLFLSEQLLFHPSAGCYLLYVPR